jgi:hypothetical protein
MNCSYPQNFLGLLSSFQRASGKTAVLLSSSAVPNRCSGRRFYIIFCRLQPVSRLLGSAASSPQDFSGGLRCCGEDQYYLGLLELVKPFSTSFLLEQRRL